MSTPVYVTGGASAKRWIEITDRFGADITSDEVRVALLPFDDIPGPSSGSAPVDVKHPVPATVQAAIMVDNTYTPGMYRLFGRITDSPEVEWLEGGLVEVR